MSNNLNLVIDSNIDQTNILRGNNISSTSHILSTRNIPENYSYLTKRLTTSSRESKDDIHYELSRTQENDIEEYYKSLFKKMRNDSNIQNEKISNEPCSRNFNLIIIRIYFLYNMRCI